jgi:hypothetical protein
VKLFFDESVGATVPSALQHVGAPCLGIFRPTRAGTILLGAADLEWLVIAGQGGYLVVTHDFGIFEVSAEKATLVASHVGAVFIPGATEPRWKVLRLVLRYWSGWSESMRPRLGHSPSIWRCGRPEAAGSGVNLRGHQRWFVAQR